MVDREIFAVSELLSTTTDDRIKQAKHFHRQTIRSIPHMYAHSVTKIN